MGDVFMEAKVSCGCLPPDECDEKRDDFIAAEIIVMKLFKETLAFTIERHAKEAGLL